MLLITVDGPFLSILNKEIMVKEFTKTASEITGLSIDEILFFFKENPNENMAQGGIILSEKLRERREFLPK